MIIHQGFSCALYVGSHWERTMTGIAEVRAVAPHYRDSPKAGKRQVNREKQDIRGNPQDIGADLRCHPLTGALLRGR